MAKMPTRKGMHAAAPKPVKKAAGKPAMTPKPHGTREGPHHVSIFRGGGR